MLKAPVTDDQAGKYESVHRTHWSIFSESMVYGTTCCQHFSAKRPDLFPELPFFGRNFGFFSESRGYGTTCCQLFSVKRADLFPEYCSLERVYLCLSEFVRFFTSKTLKPNRLVRLPASRIQRFERACAGIFACSRIDRLQATSLSGLSTKASSESASF